MLTVWSMSTGGRYSDYFVQRLQREVKKYLDMEHRFVCICDHEIEGVSTILPPTDYPGWWGKVGLFKPGVAAMQNLWLDLDVVVTSDLTDLIKSYGDEQLAMPTNWAQSGHGGCQSSVMVWRGGKGCQSEWIYRMFKPEWAHWPPVNQPGVLWGDQEHITQLRDSGRIKVTPINEKWVKSYKYHCIGRLPDDCRVVVFHGSPNPDEVSEDYFSWT